MLILDAFKRVLEYRVRAPVVQEKIREQMGENGFPQIPTTYRKRVLLLQKSPNISRNLRGVPAKCSLGILYFSAHLASKLEQAQGLYYTMPHYTVLYCTVLCCAVQYYTVLYRAIPFYTIDYTIQYNTIQHNTIRYNTTTL